MEWQCQSMTPGSAAKLIVRCVGAPPLPPTRAAARGVLPASDLPRHPTLGLSCHSPGSRLNLPQPRRYSKSGEPDEWPCRFTHYHPQSLRQAVRSANDSRTASPGAQRVLGAILAARRDHCAAAEAAASEVVASGAQGAGSQASEARTARGAGRSYVCK
jgi:hypothetical protein